MKKNAFRNRFLIICVLAVMTAMVCLWIQRCVPEYKDRKNAQMKEGTTVRADGGSAKGETKRESEDGGKDTGKDAGLAEAPRIALTFDDGPRPHTTGELLDGLKERNVKATFFMIGKYAKENSQLVKRVKEEGHVIGNHTYSHVDITQLSDADAAKELGEMDDVIYSVTGEHVRFVRPPFGAWQKELEEKMDVLPVMWTVDPLDWTTENVDEIVNKVVTEVEENDIILLHDCYKSSVEAALRIVDLLLAEGYEFVTVDELIID